MINRRTVLVLGAGASAPYGFPTGRKLLLEASTLLASGHPPTLDLLSKIGIHANTPGDFALLLKQSMQPSIDAFVENRPTYIDVGKAAIALSLIPHENQHAIEERGLDKEWYEFLFTQVGPTVSDIEDSHLTVLTFNYDRSLEYFWYHAIVRSFGLDTARTAALYGMMPIIHLHGHLGLPHFKDADSRPYSPALDLKSLRIAVTSILIPGAENIDNTPFTLASKAIAEADVLCFLGFAFHFQNVKRLGLVSKGDRAIYASAFHLSENDISKAGALIPDPITFGLQSQNALAFLENYPVLT